MRTDFRTEIGTCTVPLEALWWSEDMASFTAARDASRCETGKHHEIYLGDARRTPPAEWRTVLRPSRR